MHLFVNFPRSTIYLKLHCLAPTVLEEPVLVIYRRGQVVAIKSGFLRICGGFCAMTQIMDISVKNVYSTVAMLF